MPNYVFVNNIINKLNKFDTTYDPNDTLVATSACSVKVNRTQLSNQMYHKESHFFIVTQSNIMMHRSSHHFDDRYYEPMKYYIVSNNNNHSLCSTVVY